MARRLRYTPPNTPVEITQRILHGRLLLRPSEELRQIILGVLGRAQRLYDMPIHSYVFLSNHYHLIVTPRDAHHLAAFMAYVSGNLAREIARLYGWHRAMRLFDGPDEVHLATLGRHELTREPTFTF